jgi:hypothetical protein
MSMAITSVRLMSCVAAALITASCAAPSQQDVSAATKGLIKREDLEIVDCLLPGQVRQLGNSSYITPRRPVHTTASECRIRGGEYVAFDRANLKTALKVWMEAAEAGDAEAQNNVGEIYERGLGTEPNFEAAALWYGKSAAQNNHKAQFNLGSLYEQGLGVPADRLKALNLYRQSSGLTEDSLMYQSAAQQQQKEMMAELQKQISDKDSKLALLEKQLTEKQNQVAAKPTTQRDPALVAEVESLKKWVADLQAERKNSAVQLASVSQLRTPTTTASTLAVSTLPLSENRQALGMNFGHFYALIIGNQHYNKIDSLSTPINDVERAAKVLKEKYGFSVKVLEDADDVGMLKALNDLNAQLKEDDNLLIYYAGHGLKLQAGKQETGYWLPVNAEPPPQDTFWVPNEQITAHLGRLQAKRVLVVADSCYAGLLSSDPSYMFADSKVGYTLDYMKFKLPRRSRLLLSSGGNDPVMDVGGGNNSVFARAFLEELESNNGVLAAPELFARIQKRVTANAASNKFGQVPQFKSIKGAGHEVGDFFLVPKSKT